MVVDGALVVQGDPWPSQFPGLLGPLVAAVVVTGLGDGRPGLVDLARRMGRWRLGRAGWALALGAPLVVLSRRCGRERGRLVA